MAFHTKIDGEVDIPLVFTEPLEIVIGALRCYKKWQDMHDNLPDLDLY